MVHWCCNLTAPHFGNDHYEIIPGLEAARKCTASAAHPAPTSTGNPDTVRFLPLRDGASGYSVCVITTVLRLQNVVDQTWQQRTYVPNDVHVCGHPSVRMLDPASATTHLTPQCTWAEPNQSVTMHRPCDAAVPRDCSDSPYLDVYIGARPLLWQSCRVTSSPAHQDNDRVPCDDDER